MVPAAILTFKLVILIEIYQFNKRFQLADALI